MRRRNRRITRFALVSSFTRLKTRLSALVWRLLPLGSRHRCQQRPPSLRLLARPHGAGKGVRCYASTKVGVRKSEIRNPKSETNTKSEIIAKCGHPNTGRFEFWISDLFRISVFEFRIYSAYHASGGAASTFNVKSAWRTTVSRR